MQTDNVNQVEGMSWIYLCDNVEKIQGGEDIPHLDSSNESRYER